ncbi:MAG: rhodanese-related sulfurtransferase [Gammaproteobacteria bacterium]
MSDCVTAAFYRFVALPNFYDLRDPVRELCERHSALGTILLAREGINGTIAGAPDALEALFAELGRDPRFADLDIKWAPASAPPFYRLKVRLKREIVTLGVPAVDPVTQAGEYVEPENWNALLDDPDVVVVDTRNDYEVELGTFEGAISPDTSSFGELPAWLDDSAPIDENSRVAMFCTGGIRCEKSTALLKSRGVKEVYHLRGGILNYLEKIDVDDNRFEGHCFVFDERVAVGPDLKQGPYALCRACRHPLSKEDQRSAQFVEGVSCARCVDQTTDKQKERFAERHRQMRLAESRNEAHLGRREAPALPVLYSFRRCPFAMRARLALRMAGIDVALREVVLRDKPEAMLEVSPKATVPILIDTSGRVLEESLDIMRFALSVNDPEQWLAPEDGEVEAMNALIRRCDKDFKPDLDRYKYASRYDDADPFAARERGVAFLQTLDQQLSANGWLCGSRRSLADVAIAPFVRQFRIADPEWFDQQSFRRVIDWLATFEASADFTAVMRKYAPWQEGDDVVVFGAAA